MVNHIVVILRLARKMWDSNPRAVSDLTVFKTVPLNLTWVILHKINQNQYLVLGGSPPIFRWQSIIAPYSGYFRGSPLNPDERIIGLDTSLFTLRYDFKVVH